MKANYLLSSLLLSAATLFSCADAADNDKVGDLGLYSGNVTDQGLVDLSDAAECDALIPCTDGLDCLYIGALEIGHPICVEGGTVCDLLDCGPEGECVIAESYPGQVMCSGGGSDEPGDNCAVSSDGTTWCPDEEDDEPGGTGGGTSPGNPGSEDASPSNPGSP